MVKYLIMLLVLLYERQTMFEQYERRHLDRIKIPGAQVYYRVISGNGKSADDSALTELKDLTHIGICFQIKHHLEPGDYIELDIIIPGKEKIGAKGSIVWASTNHSVEPAYAAVQLLPFGTDSRYNSLKALTDLKAVSQEYLEPVS